MYKVKNSPRGGGIKLKALTVEKAVKIRKCHKIEMGRGRIKSKMFKLKRKKSGVRIWNQNPEYFGVRGSN